MDGDHDIDVLAMDKLQELQIQDCLAYCSWILDKLRLPIDCAVRLAPPDEFVDYGEHEHQELVWDIFERLFHPERR
jgi:hypothetical protein